MDIISHIFTVLGEIACLIRTLFTNGIRFYAWCVRARTALAAENLFLRKQPTFYQKRKVTPRSFDNAFLLKLGIRISPRTVSKTHNRKEVNGDEVFERVVKERSPGLRWRFWMTRHVLRDRGLGDLNTQLK